MIRLTRIIGFLLVGVGALILASYLIRPLRRLWPVFLAWFASLPVPVRIGLVTAAIGFVVVMGSLLWERLEDREKERGLLEK